MISDKSLVLDYKIDSEFNSKWKGAEQMIYSYVNIIIDHRSTGES